MRKKFSTEVSFFHKLKLVIKLLRKVIIDIPQMIFFTFLTFLTFTLYHLFFLISALYNLPIKLFPHQFQAHIFLILPAIHLHKATLPTILSQVHKQQRKDSLQPVISETIPIPERSRSNDYLSLRWSKRFANKHLQTVVKV